MRESEREREREEWKMCVRENNSACAISSALNSTRVSTNPRFVPLKEEYSKFGYCYICHSLRFDVISGHYLRIQNFAKEKKIYISRLQFKVDHPVDASIGFEVRRNSKGLKIFSSKIVY